MVGLRTIAENVVSQLTGLVNSVLVQTVNVSSADQSLAVNVEGSGSPVTVNILVRFTFVSLLHPHRPGDADRHRPLLSERVDHLHGVDTRAGVAVSAPEMLSPASSALPVATSAPVGSRGAASSRSP